MTEISITDIIEGLITHEAADYAASIEAPGPFDTKAAAARVVDAIELGQHGAALEYLVHGQMSGLIFGLCLFDEALSESYAKVDEVAFALAYEISRQCRHFPSRLSEVLKDLAEAEITQCGQALYVCAEDNRRARAVPSPF